MAEDTFIGCQIKELPSEHQQAAAATAISINPSNRPELEFITPAMMSGVDSEGQPYTIAPAEFLAVLTSKYWGPAGVKLGVSFLEETSQSLVNLIIAHANAWSAFCNVKFAWSQSGGEVRISRGPGGYFSYLGVDILHIPAGQQTMNLEAFTLNTPDSEYRRVVRHEFGHTQGYPHEHMRQQIVSRLDPTKTIAYFLANQGWNAQTTRQQVLTPLSAASIMGTPDADQDSIMCYFLPKEITKDGQPIRGGIDIEAQDQAFSALMYPLVTVVPSPPPPPTPPPPSGATLSLSGGLTSGTTGTYKVV